MFINQKEKVLVLSPFLREKILVEWTAGCEPSNCYGSMFLPHFGSDVVPCDIVNFAAIAQIRSTLCQRSVSLEEGTRSDYHTSWSPASPPRTFHFPKNCANELEGVGMRLAS